MTIPELDRLMEEHVRPLLREHGGDAEILSYETGILRLRMLGQCAGCPAADLTNETLIEGTLRQLVPELTQVVLVQQASEDLLDEARRLMKRSGNPTPSC